MRDFYPRVRRISGAQTGRSVQRAAREKPARSRLMIGRADDQAEFDADRLADQMVAGFERRSRSVQRRQSPGTDELGGQPLDGELASRIATARGGRAVASRIRRRVEEHSGRDLSSVRVHEGAEADDLNRSLQATAFTVGTDIFVSDAAARSGTEGDRLMAHELAHVVQQGGGVASVRRQTRLTPLASGAPTVQRLFGSKKGQPVMGATGEMETSNGLSKEDKAEQKQQQERDKSIQKTLQHDLKVWESALRKLVVNPADPGCWRAAQRLMDNAENLLHTLPASTGKASKLAGPKFPDEVKRLKHIIQDCGLILDHKLVAESRKLHGEGYVADAKAGKLKHLTGAAATTAFGNDTDNEKVKALQESISAEGDRLGLTAAETAAIATFTLQDYKYINPATANSEGWMKSQNASAATTGRVNVTLTKPGKGTGTVEKVKGYESTPEMTTMKEEGGQHASFALSGLAKLPVWKGPSYRGEVYTHDEFEKKFSTKLSSGGKKSYSAKSKSTKREAIASNSKERKVSEGFCVQSSMERNLTDGQYVNVLWIMDLVNGRDIEKLSGNPDEKEVATLPGAEFKVGKITEEMGVEYRKMTFVVVHAKQAK